MIATRSKPATKFTFATLPESLELAEFVLSVPDGPEGERLAKAFDEQVMLEFRRREPAISALYELEIEELAVWTGSRKSKKRARLRKRTAKKEGVVAWLKRNATVITLILGIASADTGKMEENLEKAIHTVVAASQAAGHMISVENIVPINTNPPGKTTSP